MLRCMHHTTQGWRYLCEVFFGHFPVLVNVQVLENFLDSSRGDGCLPHGAKRPSDACSRRVWNTSSTHVGVHEVVVVQLFLLNAPVFVGLQLCYDAACYLNRIERIRLLAVRRQRKQRVYSSHGCYPFCEEGHSVQHWQHNNKPAMDKVSCRSRTTCCLLASFSPAYYFAGGSCGADFATRTTLSS
jgi:hypothetical protein